jgi:cell division septation protein DedD
MEVITMPTTDTTTPAADGAGASSSTVGRFGRVPARWLEDPGVGVEELAVLTALAVHVGHDGVCVVRQRTLAGLLQRSREWVCRVLARLCEPGGFIEKERRADRDGWNLACRYRLPDLAAPEDGRADVPGEPKSGTSDRGADGAARDSGEDQFVTGEPPPAEPAKPPPLEPATPAPAEPVTPAPAEAVTPAATAVITPAPAGVTEDAHQEQT